MSSMSESTWESVAKAIANISKANAKEIVVEVEAAILREQLEALLKRGVVVVDFNTVNGEKRSMPCTLKESVIPAKPAEIGSKSVMKRHAALNVMSVWCTDKNEWRSFKLENVTGCKPL